MNKLKYPASRLTGRTDQERVLTEDFSLDIINGSFTLTVRKGFVCDGGSIPSWGWSALGVTPWGNPGCEVAFIVHDALYRTNLVDMITADQILSDVMERYGTSGTAKEIIYKTVRNFGGNAYEDAAENSDKYDSFVSLTYSPESS